VEQIFLPKLHELDMLLREWCGDDRALIAILTRGSRRAATISAGLDELRAAALVRELPAVNGEKRLRALEEEVLRCGTALTSTV